MNFFFFFVLISTLFVSCKLVLRHNYSEKLNINFTFPLQVMSFYFLFPFFVLYLFIFEMEVRRWQGSVRHE